MKFLTFRTYFILAALISCLLAGIASAQAQSPNSQSSSSGAQDDESASPAQAYVREKTPSIVDPAGPTISLISSEPVFVMAASLNMCGYDEGIADSAPVRKQVRDEINQTLETNEEARNKRDALCLYIAQHRMTGTELDVASTSRSRSISRRRPDGNHGRFD